jgi:ferredoxin
MSVEIFCFSGTGNSLRAARELARGLSDARLYRIVGLLKQTRIFAASDTVGIVFPVYCHTVPPLVKDFLKKLKFNESAYIFAVATTDATQCRAFIEIDKILRVQSKRLDSYFVLQMPHNMPFYVRYPEFITQERLDQMNSKLKAEIPTIREIISLRREHRVNDPHFLKPFPPGILPFMPALIPLNRLVVRKMTIFYADRKCTGCGTCEKVCLSEKIGMVNQKPMWKPDVACFQCQACINYCASHSIQQKSTRYMKSYSELHERHHDSSVSADDIAAQKRQSPLALG